jgi:hypothetical protein
MSGVESLFCTPFLTMIENQSRKWESESLFDTICVPNTEGPGRSARPHFPLVVFPAKELDSFTGSFSLGQLARIVRAVVDDERSLGRTVRSVIDGRGSLAEDLWAGIDILR